MGRSHMAPSSYYKTGGEARMLPVFSSERLVFRPFQRADVPAVFKLFSDPETMKFDGGETMKHLSEAEWLIDAYTHLAPDARSMRWAVVLKDGGHFIGSAGFHQIDWHHRRAEIGGEMLKPYRRKGLATEAMYRLIRFGFENMGFHRLTAMVSPFNHDAEKLVQRGPFVMEGRLREWERWGGRWIDLKVYGLLQHEWRRGVN